MTAAWACEKKINGFWVFALPYHISETTSDMPSITNYANDMKSLTSSAVRNHPDIIGTLDIFLQSLKLVDRHQN